MSTALPPIYEHVHIYQAVKEEKNVLHFFADRCGGQNNNRMVIIALHEIFIENSIEELSLNFLVSGHSQNENDNAHSVIEAAARKHTIYPVAQWEVAIQFVFKKTLEEVNSLKYNDVMNFQSQEDFPEYANILSDKVHKNDIVLPNKESKVYWLKLMMIKFTKNNTDQMMFKYHYSNEEWKFTTIYKPSKTHKMGKRKLRNQGKFQFSSFL